MENLNEKDLSKINEIDLDCNVYDDDDLIITNDNQESLEKELDDNRNFNSNTGVIIDLNDGDDDLDAFSFSDSRSSIPNSFHEEPYSNSSDIKDNLMTIDMETNYSEDDDFESGLVDEDLLEAKKKKHKTYPGEVEDNYWKKITAKHKESNKRGAYNMSFYFAGNPEKEAEMFNHAMGSDFDVADSSGEAAAGNISGTVSSAAGGEGGGMGESYEANIANTFTESFNSLLDSIGFEAIQNSDGTFTVMDLCDFNPDMECADIHEVCRVLEPFIHDFVVCLLQTSTGEKYNTYHEWLNWYNSLSDKPKNCADSINICDLLVNHLDECFK